jgi:hypothetical protein
LVGILGFVGSSIVYVLSPQSAFTVAGIVYSWIGLVIGSAIALSFIRRRDQPYPIDLAQAETEASAAWDLKTILRKAIALEERGEFAAAIEQFESVARLAGAGHPSAAMARERIDAIRAKLSEGGNPSGFSKGEERP